MVYSLLFNKKRNLLQNSLQVVCIIHNSRGHHWLVATTMIASEVNELKIYDSLFTYLDAEVRAVIKNLFQTARNSSFVMVKMDKQKKGLYDYGVYVIAVATSLAFGIDPTDVMFKQDVMRNHLIHSFGTK